MKDIIIEVRRSPSQFDHNGYTRSKLYIDGTPFINPRTGKQIVAIEDEERAEKKFGETRIKSGKYILSVTMSERFKRPLILVNGVPEFTGIRWHSGNTEGDSSGCLIVGDTEGWKAGVPAVFGGKSSGVEKFLTNFVKEKIEKGHKVYAMYVDSR